MRFTYNPATVTVTSHDPLDEDAAGRRTLVIREALSWIGTPFRDTQQVKGAGCDCGNFVMGVFASCGWPSQRFCDFNPEGFRHSSREIYREELEKRCTSVEAPEPGDIALFHFGRIYWHGAIALNWPLVIHCVKPHGVGYGDASYGMLVRPRQYPNLYFDPFKS